MNLPNRINLGMPYSRPLYNLHKELFPDTLENKGDRRLGNFILPDFQRGFVWNEGQCIAFVESVLLGLPLGAYVVQNDLNNLDGPMQGWLLDGQQRITALYKFWCNEYPVFGYYWSDFNDKDKRGFLLDHTFTGYEIRLETERQAKDLYMRMAYGGTNHI